MHGQVVNRRELLATLHDLMDGDEERNHIAADKALLEYIDDPAVTEAFDAIYKWYA